MSLSHTDPVGDSVGLGSFCLHLEVIAHGTQAA